MIAFNCSHCGKKSQRDTGHVNRSTKLGMNLYCSRKCSGMGRRSDKTEAELKEEKRLYDIEYRRRNLEQIKATKRAYFQRTYDPEKAAVERKKRMAAHVEYCRRPEYKAKKHKYDRERYAKSVYGEFWESHVLAMGIRDEIGDDKYLAQCQREMHNKAKRRKHL